MTASQFSDNQCLKPDTIFLTLPIIEEAITHLSSDRPTAYSDLTKLVGKVHSLETFFKLKCFNAYTFWSFFGGLLENDLDRWSSFCDISLVISH